MVILKEQNCLTKCNTVHFKNKTENLSAIGKEEVISSIKGIFEKCLFLITLHGDKLNTFPLSSGEKRQECLSFPLLLNMLEIVPSTKRQNSTYNHVIYTDVTYNMKTEL